MFGDTAGAGRLDAIYVTDTRRSQQTAAPLAARMHLTPVVLPLADISGTAGRLLREHHGSAVIYVGHSNTLPQLIRELSGVQIEPIAEEDFGEIYVLSVARFGARIPVAHEILRTARRRASAWPNRELPADKLRVLADAKVGKQSRADEARRIDEERRPADPETQPTVHAIHFDDRLVCVREQRERQVVTLAEGLMPLWLLRTDAGDRESAAIDLLVQIADRAGLAGAAEL